MTVQDLFCALEAKIPKNLSCEWDHDGLTVCPDRNKTVEKVTVALDVTDRVIDEAIANGSNVILSHHPMIFHPIFSVTDSDFVMRKVLKLLHHGISVMSFHTRLDAVSGGVNDTLATLFDLQTPVSFGNPGEEIGRIGTLRTEMPLKAFATLVKEKLHADSVTYSGSRSVYKVAILGGSGKDDVEAAFLAGADTFLTGELRYDQINDAPDQGMNLVEAGHFFTEDPVCAVLADFVGAIDPTIPIAYIRSFPGKTI